MDPTVGMLSRLLEATGRHLVLTRLTVPSLRRIHVFVFWELR